MVDISLQTSLGCAGDFAVGLCIGVYAEAVPMGIDPHLISYKDAGSVNNILYSKYCSMISKYFKGT